MKEALKRHDEIIQKNIDNSGGEIIKHTGDGVFAVFEDGNPLKCALNIQREFQNQDWEHTGEIRIRMGLHAGYAEKRGNDYFGPVINRTARVMGIAWGGQIILTPEVSTTSELPKNATLKDSGVHILKDLGEPQQIYQLIHPDLKMKEFPPLRSLSSHPNNLPSQPTPFLGREEELKELKGLLKDDSCRLLTIIGPGGIGKTRIAIQAGAEVIETFTDGVFFVPLAPLSSADFLISTIAESLNFSFYSREDEKIQLTNFLKEKNLLLIMDNFEHLTEGASIISDILNSTEKVNIMVTSRELLNLKGEWVYQIEGLEVPEGEKIDIEGYSAVQLFLDGAYRAKSSFNYTEKDRKSLIRVCQLVGGIPLGIEIASSWLRTLSLEEIKEEIEKNIDFLSSSKRDIPERHRSLRAVFDYSWNLLDEKEKNILSNLSAFRGGFTKKAAEKVGGANLNYLADLLNKSLLRRSKSGRYYMLDTIRQYAQEKLGKNKEKKEKIQNLHCEYFAELLKQKEETLIKETEKEEVKKVKADFENIRNAWFYAVENKKYRKIDKMINGFYIIHNMNGWYKEGKNIFKGAIEKIIEENEGDNNNFLYGKLLVRYGGFLFSLGSYDKSRELIKESLSIIKQFDDEKENAFALNYLGNISLMLGNFDTAIQYFAKTLKIYRGIDYPLGISGALNNLGIIYYFQNKLEEARKLYQQNLEISRKHNYHGGIVKAISNIGLIALKSGNFKEAEKLLLESLEMEKGIGKKHGLGNSYHNLGLVYKNMEEYEKAKEYYEKGLEIRKEIGDKMGISISLNNLGNLIGIMGDNDRAIDIHKESLEIRKEMGDIYGQSQSYLNIGGSCVKKEDFKSSLAYYNKALELSLKGKHMDVILESILGIGKASGEINKKEDFLRVLLFLKQCNNLDFDLRKRVEENLKEIEGDFNTEIIKNLKEEVKDRKIAEFAEELMNNNIT